MRAGEEAFEGSRRFDVLARLGDGGSGVVYRARDRRSGSDIALKVMRRQQGDGLTQFRAEFSALQLLRHPNLVELYDLVEEQGRVLLAMELVEGHGLFEFLREDTSCERRRVRESFRQLAEALLYLHRELRVHRDVKPSNVRVTPEGRVVLLDLDFAWLESDEDAFHFEPERPLRPAGTALYMAPEQAALSEVRAASDWYALGVVLYEALTGSLPWRGTELEVLMAKQDGKPTPPHELDASIPLDLSDLCVDLLGPVPELRPSGDGVLQRLALTFDAVVRAPRTFGSTCWVGRKEELERLHAAFLRSREGPVVVRVQGAAGLGKTALCARFSEEIARQYPDAVVLQSACPRYPERPHAPFSAALMRLSEIANERVSSLLREDQALLVRAFPQVARIFSAVHEESLASLLPDPLERRFRLVEAFGALLHEVAAVHPLVWWFDDYEWADLDSQRLLSALVRNKLGPRVLFLLCDESAFGQRAYTEPSAHETLQLADLAPDEARALLRKSGLLTALDEVAEQKAEVLPGNPLLLEYSARQALEEGSPRVGERTLAQLIAERIAALPEPARKLLYLLATARDPLTEELCQSASGLSRSEFARHCSVLEARELMRKQRSLDGTLLAVAHAAIAECVDSELLGGQRAEVHRRLAQALTTADPTRAPGRLLRHQGESGLHSGAAQSAWLSAEQAHSALAFQRAAELFTLATSLDPPRRDEMGHLRLQRVAEALGHAGWSVQAATVYRQAALGANSAAALHMRQRAAEHLLRGAKPMEGLEAVRELLSSIDVALPATPGRAFWSMVARRSMLRLRGLRFESLTEGQVSVRDLRRVDALWTSGVQLSLVDVIRGADFLTRGLQAALKTGEPHRVARALCTEAWMRGLDRRGDLVAESLLVTAEQLTQRHPSALLDGHLRLARGIVAFGKFHLPECYVHCREAERVFRERCADAMWEVTSARVFQLVSLANMARYQEQAVMLESVTREAKERGDLWGYSYFVSIGAMGAMLADGRPEEAEACVREESQRWATGTTFHFQHWVALLASVYIDLYLGRTSVLERLEGPWNILKQTLFLRLPFAHMALHELRGRAHVLAARVQKDASQLARAERDARVLARAGDDVSLGFAHLVRANVAHLRGNVETSVGELHAGIQLLEARGLEMWVLAAKRVLGRQQGGDAGHELTRAAERTLKERGVRDLDRFQNMLMPAFAN